MVCIVEGANASGKSTFIEQIRKDFPVYRALKALDRDTINRNRLTNIFESDMYVADYLAQTGQNVVFERSPLSAVIYNDLPFDTFEDWISVLPNPTLIIFTSNYLDSVSDEYLASRNLTRKQAELIHKVYQTIDFTGVPIKVYKVDNPNTARIIVEEDFNDSNFE